MAGNETDGNGQRAGVRPAKERSVDDRLRRMGRRELIEIIYAQQKNEAELESQLERVKSQLQRRTLAMSQAGSIAEAALALNGVFDKAQAAADQYLASVAETEARAKEDAQRIVETARTTAAEIVAKASQRADAIEKEAHERAHLMEADAQTKAKALLADAEKRAQQSYEQAERIMQEANKALEGVKSLEAGQTPGKGK